MKLLFKGRKKLNKLYEQSKAKNLPQGITNGVAILAIPIISVFFALFIKLFIWKGKIFSSQKSETVADSVINRVSPFNIKAVKGRVYLSSSWIDGKPTIVIEYNKSGFPFNKVRDEVREMEPGVYVGKMWFYKTQVLHFTLTYKK